MPDTKRLDRILKVRTLQLGLVRAEEARANERFVGEVTLRNRIAALAADIAPAPSIGPGFSLVAAAHFRDRLQQSAEAANGRLRAAEQLAQQAAEKTREAKRDQSAIEKLLDRAMAEQAVKEIRALEAAPPSRKIRHDPC
jgi:flagellar FliJ protein